MLRSFILFAFGGFLLPALAFSKESPVQVNVNIRNTNGGNLSGGSVSGKSKRSAKRKSKAVSSKTAQAPKVQKSAAPVVIQPVVIERLEEPEYLKTPTPVLAPDATTKAKIKPVAKVEKKSRWRFRYRTYNGLAADYVYNESPEADSEVAVLDRFDITYSITDKTTISLMPQFHHTWFGGRDRAQNSKLSGLDQSYAGFVGNTAIILATSELAKLSGGTVLDGMLRYDLPTSEVSLKSDSLGEFWVDSGLSKDWKYINLRGSFTGRYYLQQYETSSLTDVSTGEEIQNRQYRVRATLANTFKVTPAFNISLSGGFMNEGRYGDTRVGSEKDPTRDDFITFGVDLGYEFTRNFALNLGYGEEGANMRNLGDQGWQPFSAKNGGEYYLMATVVF